MIRRAGHAAAARHASRVGQVFLPRTDLGAQERAALIVETEILRFGFNIYGWRQVPMNVDVIGEKANATRPEIEQIMICNARGVGEEQFERDLYVIRRRIEKAAIEAEHHGVLHLLALLPLAHLQGHVPGRAARRILSRPARRALHLAFRDLPPALFDQHLPRPGGWPSPSACWPTTARSTR